MNFLLTNVLVTNEVFVRQKTFDFAHSTQVIIVVFSLIFEASYSRVLLILKTLVAVVLEIRFSQLSKR